MLIYTKGHNLCLTCKSRSKIVLNTVERKTCSVHLPWMLFSAAELWQEGTMDDRTVDLSIMHKIVREMTGTLLVGSL